MTEEIVEARAEEMDEHVRSVDLTVTSPPYLDSVDYDAYKHDGDYKGASKASGEGGPDISTFASWMGDVSCAVLNATTDGGYAAVVSGTIKVDDHEWFPVSHVISSAFMRAGWSLHEHIVWDKITGGSSRFGTTVQHPYPGYYYPNQMHESILVFRKGGVVRHRDDESKIDTDCEVVIMDCGQNVWHIPPVRPNEGVDHPAPFPEELVYRLIKFYSPASGLVADPMCGSGTVPKVAKHTGRDYWAGDSDPDFVSTAKQRTKESDLSRYGIVPRWESAEPEGP